MQETETNGGRRYRSGQGDSDPEEVEEGIFSLTDFRCHFTEPIFASSDMKATTEMAVTEDQKNAAATEMANGFC
ncbi:hypothetical protein AMTR_s00022p00234770 [Amborella trichopoda]|uniref:Uncharacterized protein n=1 Tax=Amborella trichopoda TaxID=13333 RepID=W1PWK3_AMBTC|nr:hypothetical protein AMTR_s00022p00234770 [Amborella trichopoda]